MVSARNTNRSLWELALDCLSPEDKARFPFGEGDIHGHLESVLQQTMEARERFSGEKWKIEIRGNAINLRDYFDNILQWVEKYKPVGDIAMQYDPVHAALPWAGIRFLLQVYALLGSCLKPLPRS